MTTRFAILAVAILVAAAACSDESLLDIRENPTDLFWSLDLNEKAINLALDESNPDHSTFQLEATPRTVDGERFALPDGVRPDFESADTNRVTVTEDGLVRAKAVTPGPGPVMIIASLTAGRGPVSNADTAWVTVTEDVRPIESFSIQPLRTRYGVGYDTTMVARALGPDGDPVAGVSVHYSSSVAKVAAYEGDGLFRPLNEGTVMLRASTLAYGTPHSDSVEITVTEPEVFAMINNGDQIDGQVTLFFDPNVLTIKAGQGVAFTSGNFGCVYGITFHDPDDVGPSPVDGASGDIPFFCGVGEREIRMFPVPGTYTFEAGALFGFPTIGEPKIIVEPADS